MIRVLDFTVTKDFKSHSSKLERLNCFSMSATFSRYIPKKEPMNRM